MSIRPTSIREHDDGHDRWRITDAAPASELAGIVDRYGGWEETTTSFTTRRELASTSGVFIINLGAPLEIVDAGGRVQRFASGEGFVGGIAEGTSLSHSTGAMAGIHVHLPLIRLTTMLGISAADLTGRVVRLSDLRDRSVADLASRVVEAANEEARFSHLDRFFSARADRLDTNDAVALAFALLRRRGPRPVERAAEALGWSRKRVARTLEDATGLLPRKLVRLARFDRFVGAVQSQGGASLAELASDAGYADQAHLTRDARRLSAMTPAELRRRLIPAVGGVRHD